MELNVIRIKKTTLNNNILIPDTKYMRHKIILFYKKLRRHRLTYVTNSKPKM